MTITTAADDILEYLLFYLSEKIKLKITCEFSARQMIDMKCKALFFLNKCKKNKKGSMSFATSLLHTLRVKFADLFSETL